MEPFRTAISAPLVLLKMIGQILLKAAFEKAKKWIAPHIKKQAAGVRHSLILVSCLVVTGLILGVLIGSQLKINFLPVLSGKLRTANANDLKNLEHAVELLKHGKKAEAKVGLIHLKDLAGKAGSRANLHLGEIYFLDRDFQSALTCFSNAAELDPSEPSALAQIVICNGRLADEKRREAGLHDDFVKNHYTLALEQQPYPSLVGDTLYAAAHSWIFLGDTNTARNLMLRTTELPPEKRGWGYGQACNELNNRNWWGDNDNPLTLGESTIQDKFNKSFLSPQITMH